MKKPSVREIAADTYLINEFDGSYCYLLLGEARALLIDCGTGLCDLQQTVRGITPLPVLLTATHGHVDHIGGAGAFEALYLHEADCKRINRLQMTVPMRKIFTCGNGAVKANGVTAAAVKKGAHKTRLIPIQDGHAFDLGGRTVTVHHTPGHTAGSVALIDEKEKLVFSGDNVCDALWLHMPGRVSVEEWLPGAEWLYDMSKTHRVWWGHRKPLLESDYIKTVVEWGKAILRSQERNTLFPVTKQYPPQADGILYKTNTVFKKG